MRNLFMTTIFSIVSIVGAQAFASDIEDYAGLPVYQDDMIANPQAEVINEEHTGYDGLPVSQRVKPVLQSAEVEYQEGYDGLPLFETQNMDMFAIQE